MTSKFIRSKGASMEPRSLERGNAAKAVKVGSTTVTEDQLKALLKLVEKP